MAPTADAHADNPFSAALALQSDWWVQMMGLQSAWWGSVAEWQRQVLEQDWPTTAPWLRWLVWHNGTEQLG